MEKEVKIIKLEIKPKDIVSIFSSENYKNPIPKDSIFISIDYNKKTKRIDFCFLSNEKGFKIEEDFVDVYKNKILGWDLENGH